MIRAKAILGHSEGNGHPRSFHYSSIVNGYSDEGLARSRDGLALRLCSPPA